MATTENGKSIYKQFSNRSSASEAAKLTAAPKDKPLPYRQIQRSPIPPVKIRENDHLSRVSVHIAGMQYRLIAPDKEGEAYVREIAEKADQLILQIQKNTPGMALTSVIVLSLVNAMDELHQKDLQISDLKLDLLGLTASKDIDKSNYMHLREINWELKKEVLRLQSAIDTYENGDSEEEDSDEKKSLLPLEELEYDILELESVDD